MKNLSPQEKFEHLSEILAFLKKMGPNYSIQLFQDWTVALKFGNVNVKTKRINELLVYLKRTFKE